MTGPIVGPPFDDLSPLSHKRVTKMRAAANELFAALESCAREDRHPVRDVIGANMFARWQRYPPRDVVDRETGSSWFYHAHDLSEARPWDEHGHFHCFAFAEKVSEAAKPLASPRRGDPNTIGVVHLVALSIDRRGVPNRLFTLNRWLSNEWLFAARHVTPLVDRFRIRKDDRFQLTSRWLSAMLRLFQPQIAWLLHERDRVLQDHRASDPDNFAEDTAIEITATASIDVDRQLAALEQAWARPCRSRAR